MEHDNPIVGGKPQIALDARAHFNRRCERGQAIFRWARTVMQAPVSETGRPRVERISS
jgi:hypothetical protein